jgi:predicted metal-dependent hydrolase
VSQFDLPTERRIYHEGIRLFNEGHFFEAHEAWEEAWSQVPDRRRERFYRAIIRGAVTLELLRRGRAVGVRQVFVDCLNTFEGLPPIFMGLDIAGFIAALRHAIGPTLEDLEARDVPIDPSRLFHIKLLYDPFEDSQNGENADGPTGGRGSCRAE